MKTKFAAGLVLGAAMVGTLVAGPAAAATPTGDRHGNVEGTYRSRGACEEAGREGQRHHHWRWFDCDRRDDHGHGRWDGRHDRHDNDDWVLRVSR